MANLPINLTGNEKKVLKELIRDGRLNDTKIAESISITQQAVYQIRNRLESLGVIEGYKPIINLKSIGLNVVSVVGIIVLADTWEKFKEHEINKKLLDLPCVVKIMRFTSADVSYILILNFKNIEDRENFLAKLESKLSKMIRVKWSYTAHIDNFIEQSKIENINYALSDKDIDFNKLIDKIYTK